MSEAASNSKEIKEIEVSKTILPENKIFESESLKYEINIPDWLIENIDNYEKSSKINNWAWDKRWKSRDPNEWVKGYKKWKEEK